MLATVRYLRVNIFNKLPKMSNMKKTVINQLILACPDLKNDIESYIADYHDEYLHLIFGDIFNPHFHNLLEQPEKNREQLLSISLLIENMTMLDEYFSEVVVTTVLERLADDRPKLSAFKSLAGKNTINLMNNM